MDDKQSLSDVAKMLGEELAFLKDAKSTIQELGDSFADILSVSADINKAFTQNRQRIEEMQYAIADAAPGVIRLGGKLESVGKVISDIAIASNRNVIANTESIEKLYAASQILGDVDLKNLVGKFADIGVSFNNIAGQLEESISYVQSIGGNAAEVMEEVVAYTDELNRFNFSNGVQGLTKMAAQASMLRFSMRETFSFAEQALDPEKAVELSSAFQRLGVMSGTLSDPFQLMNQSINDPEGLQDSIINMTKQFTYFDEKTKSFKINPQGMLTLREIQKQTGLNAAELSKAGLAAAELDARLSDISPKITFANEEDKQYLANIASMNEKGEYTVKLKDESGREYMKNLSDVTQDEMNKLIEEQKKGPQKLEDIQRNQLTASENILNDVRAIKQKIVGGLVTAPSVVKAGEKITQGATAVTGTLSERGSGFAEVPTVRGYGEDFVQSIANLVTDATSGNKSPMEVLEGFVKSQESLFGKIEGDLSTGSEKVIGKLSEKFQKIGIDPKPFLDYFELNQNSSTEQSQKTIEALSNVSYQLKSGILPDQKAVSLSMSDKRLTDYMKESSEALSQLNSSYDTSVNKYTEGFTKMVDNIKAGVSSPDQLKEWINQNQSEIQKLSTGLYTSMVNVSDKIQESSKTAQTNGAVNASNLDNFMNGFKDSVNKLGSATDKDIKNYESQIKGLLSQIQSGQKTPEALMQYLKENKGDMKEYGESFYSGMERYVKELSSSITKDAGSVKEELSNTKIEGKSSFIEGSKRASEPIKAGQVDGGQSLTQVIQHKVEFGKITVDVQLPGNFSNLSTEQQQRILDQVFNNSKFTGLFARVEELSGNKLKQSSVGAGNQKNLQ